ncbi:MAG: hypothetical protein V3S08_07885 [Phycisphaerales bacterium]
MKSIFVANRDLRLATLTVALVCAALARAGVTEVDLTEPTLDRWFYPFNASPGFRSDAPIFGSVTDQEVGFDPSFDNRDGQMLIGFDTSALVPTGLGAGGYTISQASVRITIKSDLTFEYDPTVDPYTSWLPSLDPDFTADPDPGRPLELFGVGFRCDFTPSTYPENGPFCDNCSCFPPNPCRELRCVYPVEACVAGDVSNNVDDGFDPVPFGVATSESLRQGESVPSGTVLTFEIDVADPCIQQYLAGALDEGMLDLLIASIFFAAEGQAGNAPKIYCKEDLLVQLNVVDAAQLQMTVSTGGPVGDIDGDGLVGINDFLLLLGAWGPCDMPCPPVCAADLDGDCDVGITDFLTLLANWT